MSSSPHSDRPPTYQQVSTVSQEQLHKYNARKMLYFYINSNNFQLNKKLS